MSRLFHFLKWTGVLGLVAVQALYFQCPTPPMSGGIDSVPTATPTRPAPTPTSTVRRPVLPPLSSNLAQLSPPQLGWLAEWLTPCPGTTTGILLTTPPDWEVTSTPGGFVAQNPHRNSGIRFSTAPGSDAATSTVTAWDEGGLEHQLSQRGIVATHASLGQTTIWGRNYDAYFWQGAFTPTVSFESSAVHGRYRLQTTPETEFIGFVTLLPYGQTTLEIVGYAPSDLWLEESVYMATILASMEEPPSDWSPLIGGGESSEPLSPTAGWGFSSSFSSSRPGYSLRFPAPDMGWNPPQHLANEDGFQLTANDPQVTVVGRILRGGDPAALLSGWTAPALTNATFADGAPVTLLGGETPSRIASGVNGSNVEATTGVAYAAAGEYVLEMTWSAPSGAAWEDMQETFAALLPTVQVWVTEADAPGGLMVSYPADWSQSAAPGGEGLWAQSADGLAGLVVWVRASGDLSSWNGVALGELANWTELSMEDGPSTYLLGDQQPTKSWQGVLSSGETVQGRVVMVPHQGSVLEIAWYGPVEQWDALQERVFGNMRGMITAP